jgi:16S rRNA (adenine1518-N6/adenine1519-N6)-dimethyltransferase
MENKVKAKKKFGQHFLKDRSIAQKVASLIPDSHQGKVLEIGPGTGMLTQYLLPNWGSKLYACEIDRESVAHLMKLFQHDDFTLRIWEGDFLQHADQMLHSDDWFVIGNFPYNISSQILFTILKHRHRVSGFGGMFQKEVAQRICSGPHQKAYGILSVLTDAFYDVKYAFTVSEGVFHPPPKVKTGVIYGVRKATFPDCDHDLLFEVVKTAFNQRRKTLSNSLKKFNDVFTSPQTEVFSKLRAENLSTKDFIVLTQRIEELRHGAK